jgi:hypothetical protein
MRLLILSMLLANAALMGAPIRHRHNRRLVIRGAPSTSEGASAGDRVIIPAMRSAWRLCPALADTASEAHFITHRRQRAAPPLRRGFRARHRQRHRAATSFAAEPMIPAHLDHQ